MKVIYLFFTLHCVSIFYCLAEMCKNVNKLKKMHDWKKTNVVSTQCKHCKMCHWAKTIMSQHRMHMQISLYIKTVNKLVLNVQKLKCAIKCGRDRFCFTAVVVVVVVVTVVVGGGVGDGWMVKYPCKSWKWRTTWLWKHSACLSLCLPACLSVCHITTVKCRELPASITCSKNTPH